MTEDQFVDRAAKFLGERLGAKVELDGDTELIDSGLLDSLMVLEFFFFLEDVTGNVIDPEQARTGSLTTLRTAYRELVAS